MIWKLFFITGFMFVVAAGLLVMRHQQRQFGYRIMTMQQEMAQLREESFQLQEIESQWTSPQRVAQMLESLPLKVEPAVVPPAKPTHNVAQHVGEPMTP